MAEDAKLSLKAIRGADGELCGSLSRWIGEEVGWNRPRRDGLQLVGESGLLTGLVKLVLEGALEAEMAEHLGYEKGDPAGAVGTTTAGPRAARPCSPRRGR